jgi:hypothetical protein
MHLAWKHSWITPFLLCVFRKRAFLVQWLDAGYCPSFLEGKSSEFRYPLANQIIPVTVSYELERTVHLRDAL